MPTRQGSYSLTAWCPGPRSDRNPSGHSELCRAGSGVEGGRALPRGSGTGGLGPLGVPGRPPAQRGPGGCQCGHHQHVAGTEPEDGLSPPRGEARKER